MISQLCGPNVKVVCVNGMSCHHSHWNMWRSQWTAVTRLTLSNVGDRHAGLCQAGTSFKLALVAICDGIGAADWSPLHLACNLATHLIGHSNINAFSSVHDADFYSLQASISLELAQVSVCDGIGAADWSPLHLACNLATHLGGHSNIDAFSSVHDADFYSLQASISLELAQVSVCHGVGAADWSPLHLACNFATHLGGLCNINARAIMQNSDCCSLQASISLELAQVSVCHGIGAADWSPLHRAPNLATHLVRLRNIDAHARVHSQDRRLLLASCRLEFTQVAVCDGVTTTNRVVLHRASLVASLAASNGNQKQKWDEHCVVDRKALLLTQ
jgi:hypothetical protein